MRGCGLLVGLLLLFGAWDTQAFAENRVALVIGNTNYKNVAKLPNPGNDAAAVAKLFKIAGFAAVELRQDLEIAELRHVFRNFSDAAREAEIAVVFYAGHGIEVNGDNYLIPVDAKLERDIDVEDEAVSLERVLTMIEPARRLRLVILDACRDNPFLRTMKRTLADRAIGRGLARVEPTTPDTLIAFAAKAGSTAADGEGPNSPFTSALLNHLAAPGLDVRLALGLVRDEVLSKTKRRQEPFVYGSLGGEAISLVPSSPAQKHPEPMAGVGDHSLTDIRSDYALAEKIGTVAAWDSFLEQYHTGFYANLARAARAKMLAAEAVHKRADEAGSKPHEEDEQRTLDMAHSGAEPGLIAPARDKPPVAPNEPISTQPEAQNLAKQAVAPAKEPPPPTRPPVAAAPGGGASATTADVAALEPAPNRPVATALDSGDLARRLQTQLQRVGCDPGKINGQWNRESRRALEAFNRQAGTKLDPQVASLDALELVKTKTSRVCALICGRGSRAHGDHCVELEKPSSKSTVHHLHREQFVRSRSMPSAPPPSHEPQNAGSSGSSSKTCNFIHGAMFCF